MIIENMEQAGKAMDAGRQLMAKAYGVEDFEVRSGSRTLKEFREMVAGGRIYTAPLTIKLYEYEEDKPSGRFRWRTEPFKDNSCRRTGTLTITEDE